METQQLFDLSGRVALITGGAQGLGRMIAEGLLRAGATVAITSRKADVAEAAAHDMSALGTCVALPANLATAEAATELATRYGEKFDRCDILINNAGKTWGAPLENFPDKAWPDIMTVNVQVPFTLARDLLPLMERSASPDWPASIVNIGSAAGAKVEHINAYSYTASKAAIHMLTREMAAELAGKSITVNAVIPGYFPTRMTAHLRDEDNVDPEILGRIPMARLGTADDIAGAIIFLSSRADDI